jgi:hypothetical protein
MGVAKKINKSKDDQSHLTIIKRFLHRSAGIYAYWILWIYILMAFLFLCSIVYATDYFSGQQYTFSTTYNEDYIYLWSASDGKYSENDGDTFTWTAPDVKSPGKVTISILVSDKGICSCNSIDSIQIEILPTSQSKQEANSLSNEINSSRIDSIAILSQNLSLNDSMNSFALIMNLSGNGTEANLTYDEKLNVASVENNILENKSVQESLQAKLDRNDTETNLVPKSDLMINIEDTPTNTAKESEPSLSVEGVPSKGEESMKGPLEEAGISGSTSENPSGVEIQSISLNQNDQTKMETCLLSFDDGTTVQIDFNKNNLLTETAYTISQQNYRDPANTSSLDKKDTPLSLNNATKIPESGIEQADSKVNTTEIEKSLPESGALSDSSNDKTSTSDIASSEANGPSGLNEVLVQSSALDEAFEPVAAQLEQNESQSEST